MSPATLRDIDSLPYHALQAEAAKHSIRRNLGAAKLREALRELLGNNPNPNKLPSQWFIAATHPAPSKSQEAHNNNAFRPIKTNARIKSATQNPPRLPLMPQSQPLPRATQARRTKNTSVTNSRPLSNSQPLVPSTIHERSSPPTHVSSKRDQPAQTRLNRDKPETKRIPSAATSSSIIDHPPSPQVTKQQPSSQNYTDQSSPKPRSRGKSPQTHDAPTRNSCSPQPATKEPSQTSSSQILPQTIRDEVDRLGFTNCCNERNVHFLTRLVRDALEELHRGHHVLCTLQTSSKPIKYVTPKSTPTSHTKAYLLDALEASNEIPTLPPPTKVTSPHLEDQTEKSQSEICKASDPNRHPRFYVSTPANSAAFQPPRIPLPSLTKTLDPSSISCDHLPLMTDTHRSPHSHPDQTSTSSVAAAISLDQPLHTNPTTIADPFTHVGTPAGRCEKVAAGPQMTSPMISPVDDTFASPHRETPLRHKSREKRSMERDEVENQGQEEPEEGLRQKKKTRLEEGSSTNIKNDQEEPINQKAVQTLAQIQIPNRPLRLFKSPPKPHFILNRNPPVQPNPLSSSPTGPINNPTTLFGTEHYYGDSSHNRFGEMFLNRSNKFLPSPLNKKN